MFCNFYGILGHDLKHCAAHYAVEKKGGRVEYQYGDFLRAAGGRPRASASKNTSPMSNVEEGNGSEAKQISGLAEQGGLQELTAARKTSSGNPSSVDKGDFVIQGMDAKNMHNNSVGHDCHANVKETNTNIGGFGLEIQHTYSLIWN